MRAAVNRIDVVGEGIDLLVVTIVVLDGDFDSQRIALSFEIQRLIVQRSLVLVEMFDEFSYAALVIKLVRSLRLFALVFDGYANAFVEKGLFAKSLRQFVETENG